MCWSNLQLELVQQAWPLKGLMQCQNLWLRGHPSLLASTIWQKLNFFPLTIRFSFPLYWIHLWGRHEMWDVNETFSLEGRRIPGQRRGWSSSEPMTSLPIFFFVLTFASCHSRRYAACWLKSAACHGRHISERHKTCRNINKQQAADSSQAAVPVRRDEGKVRTRGGCCAVEVSSSGFTETQRRQDKVYQVISQFKLLLGQPGNGDPVCQMISACVSDLTRRVCRCVAFGGIINHDNTPATSCKPTLTVITTQMYFCGVFSYTIYNCTKL